MKENMIGIIEAKIEAMRTARTAYHFDVAHGGVLALLEVSISVNVLSIEEMRAYHVQTRALIEAFFPTPQALPAALPLVLA